jgi:hypothetical protein
MYEKAFDLVKNSGQGIVLEPPKVPYMKTRKRYDSYMSAKYIVPHASESCDKWITKEQAVQYCDDH